MKNSKLHSNASPIDWNDGKPLRDTLLGLYKTEVAPDVESDVIYTFWVKHAICTDPTCKKEVPLFKDFLIAYKSMSVYYWRDVECPKCGKAFDWETQPATMIAERELMINAGRGSAGEGRPKAAWTFHRSPRKPKKRSESVKTTLDCPCCATRIELAPPWDVTRERKKVPVSVLLCPHCESVWQWRRPAFCVSRAMTK